MTKTIESVIDLKPEQLRAQVIERLQTADDSLLRMVHVLLQVQVAGEEVRPKPDESTSVGDEDPVIAHLIDGTPLRRNAFFKEAAEGVEEIRNGGGRSADEVIEEKLAWIRSMK